MTSRAANALTTLLVIVTLSIAAFAVWKFYDLQRAVQEQRDIFKQQEMSIAANRATIGEQERELAVGAGESAYLFDGLVTTDDFLRDTVAGSRRLCSDSRISADTRSFCTYLENGGELILQFNAALFSRASRTTDRDFIQIEARYRELLAVVIRVYRGNPDPGWVSYAEEGIAYARYRRRQYSPAAEIIARARARSPFSAVVGLTHLKIQCASGADRGRVQAELQNLRSRLDSEIARVARLPDPTGRIRRNKALERRLVEQDGELYYVCRDAGIRRDRIASR